MKKLYTLTAALLMSIGVAWSQHNVTFQVDMTGQTISANGVHVAGNFQQAAGASGNWQPGATSMSQVGTSNIYEVTVNIPSGNYEYKFINDNDWPGVEGVPGISQVSLGIGLGGGNDNRYVSVAGDTVLPAVVFGGAAPTGMENVTMVVDMGQEANIEDTVSVAGDFQGWTPGKSIMFDLLNDSVYRYVAYLPGPDTLNFKFVNGNAWGQDESVPSACAVSNNRQLIVNSDTLFGPICYAQCGPCFIPDTFNVTLQVDMSATCGFDPATDQVDVAGPFNNWPGSFDPNTEMTDVDNDLIYEVTLRMPAPSMEYKARFHTGSANWESGNNRVVNFNRDTTINVRCFGFETYGACAPKPDPSDITFQVDMTNGPANFVKVFLIGDFTDPVWQGGAVELTPSTTQAGVFETTINGICPGKIAYKYMIEDGSGNQVEEDFTTASDTSCLEPSGTGNYNRFYLRPDDQPKTLSAPWELCSGVSLSEVSQADFSVYPNPFTESTTIALPAGKFTLEVVDITGKTLFSLQDAQNRVELQGNRFAPGVYLIRVSNGEGYAQTEKVVIR